MLDQRHFVENPHIGGRVEGSDHMFEFFVCHLDPYTGSDPRCCQRVGRSIGAEGAAGTTALVGATGYASSSASVAIESFLWSSIGIGLPPTRWINPSIRPSPPPSPTPPP